MYMHVYIYIYIYVDHVIPVSACNVVLHSAGVWLETMIHCSTISMSGISGPSFKLHMAYTGIYTYAYILYIYTRLY